MGLDQEVASMGNKDDWSKEFDRKFEQLRADPETYFADAQRRARREVRQEDSLARYLRSLVHRDGASEEQ